MSRQFRRRLLQTSWVISLIAALAYAIMELVYWTNRWRVVGDDFIRARWDAGQPAIICFWHNRLFMMCRCWRRGAKAKMLISQHRDGVLIAKTISHYDVGTIEGSTSRGASAALRGLIAATEAGVSIGITPDGPRGPRYHVAPGAVYLAKVTGLPIVPVTVATSRRKMLRSWDRFLINLPFGRGVYYWGEPIYVTADSDDTALEIARQKLETAMRNLSAAADRAVGYEPIPVADAKG